MPEQFQSDQLRTRTKQFALRTIRLFRALPRADEARIIGRQLLRSATAVAANYRATTRSRSRAEFIARIGVVVEETDETVFWLEMLIEAEIVSAKRLGALLQEAHELLAIFGASQRTAKRRKSNEPMS